MQKQFFSIVLLISTVTACNSNRDHEAMDAIARSLKNANDIIINNSEGVYDVLDKKSRNYCTKAKALIWNPKALRVKKLSAECYAYLDSLQKQVALPGTNSKDIRRFLNKESDRLYRKLLAYSLAVPAVIDTTEFADNPFYIEHLKKDFISIKKMIAGKLEMEGNSARQWVVNHFDHSTPSLVSMMLYKLKNNILAIENTMIEYLKNQIGGCCGYFESYSFIGIISTSRVKAGQTIEINAGKGDYRSEADPIITIDDSTLTLNTDGTATYNFIARGKPGKYYVPVKIAYYEPDGRRLAVTKNLEYIIAE